MSQCTYPDCLRPVRADGLCATHYQQRRRTGQLKPINPYRTPPAACSFEGCHRTAAPWHGLCDRHRRQQRAGKPLQPIKPRARITRQTYTAALRDVATGSTLRDAAAKHGLSLGQLCDIRSRWLPDEMLPDYRPPVDDLPPSLPE